MFGYYPQAMMSVWRRIGLSLTIALLLSVCLRAENTRNVLVLHEGSANLPFNELTSQVFREILGSDMRNQLFEEYIDENRLRGDDEFLMQTLRKKYAGKKMALVVTIGASSLQFLERKGEELWPATPKLFGVVDFRRLPAKLPLNMTGVTTSIDFGALLDLALQLKPDTRRVFYVGGTSPREKQWRIFAEQDFRRFAGKIEFSYLNDLPFSELLDQLGRLPDYSVVIYEGIEQDPTGQAYVPAQVCSVIAAASNAPVYGPYDVYIGRGIVGGDLVPVAETAEQTARLGLQVLERGTASGIPVESSTNRVVVDWRQLQKWGISEKRLPPGTVVQFRAPSLWEQYKWYLLAGLAAIIAQLALIIILAMEIRRRRKSDLAIKNLSGRLINAGEEERKRIARELHDDIGQRLSLVSLELDEMEGTTPLDESTPRRYLDVPLEQLSEIITDVHNLSHQLHSSKLQVLGLEMALKEVCHQLAKQHGLDIPFTADNLPFPLQEELALCFYRVTQEALNNAVKHSGSTRVEVRVAACDGTLNLTVKDYGAGFDPSSSAHGLGLATMRERMRLVGGELQVSTQPGKGTELTARAPLGSSLLPTAA